MPKPKKTTEPLPHPSEPQPSYFDIVAAEVAKARQKRLKAERKRLRKLGLKPPAGPKIPVTWDNLLMLH